MKIVHLRASNFYGGPERQLHIHAILAKEAGIDITIASFSEAGNSPEFLNIIASDDIRTHLFHVKNAYDRRAIGQVREYLTDNDIDIICSHDYRSHLIVFRGVKKTGAKWIAFSRGWTRDDFKVRLYHLLDKMFIRFADHIVAVSQAQKQRLERLMIPSQRITVAHNSIEPERLARVEKIDLRKKFNLPSESIIAIAGGRFSREKGQSILVKAAAMALRKNEKLRLILFGDGPDLNQIRGSIRRIKLEDRIICPGFEKNLLGCLKEADMLINPSLSEGLPNIVLEAMALKIPVVATSVGGVPELIVDRVSGLLVAPGDIENLSKAISYASDDMNLRQRLSDAAFMRVLESFSFNRQMDILGEVYQKVCAKA